MLKYGRIDISEGIDVDKTDRSKGPLYVMVHILVMIAMI